MSGEAKDPAIKLFGMTIPLPDISPTVTRAAVDDNDPLFPLTSCSSPEDKERVENEEDDKELLDRNPGSSEATTENPRTPPEKETSRRKESKPGNSSQDKTLKKPDKILPCPRCKSMDTKFCYYNNYNVNQPRHFCKNCQRYWTAGGMMRNVPVGAGRRKNKSSGSPNHYHHLIVSEALHNGPPTVLAFPPESTRVPCFPGSQLPFPWSPVPPFYPGSAYFVPWFPQLSSPNTNTNTSMNSPTLGKHSRDEATAAVLIPSGSEKYELIDNPEQCLWMPKTIRIDDPRKAAKSSICAALADSHGGRIFKSFQPKGQEEKNHMVYETDSVLHANPAALTRSLNFHEGT